MAGCSDVRYATAAAAYESLQEADERRRAPRLHPCGECHGWHLAPRRVTRAQWLTRRRQQAVPGTGATA